MKIEFQKYLKDSLFSENQQFSEFVNSDDVNLEFDNNFLLYQIIESVNILGFKYSLNETSRESLKLLLNDKRVLNNSQRFIEDAKPELIDYILNHLKEQNNLHYINFNTFNKHNTELSKKFVLSCKRGNYKVFKELLDHPLVKVNFNANEALYQACSNGRVKIFKELIKNPLVDPSDNGQRCLYASISANSHQILSILLKDKRIDPSKHENHSFIFAKYKECNSYRSVTACVNLLKNDNRIVLSSFDNAILYRTLVDMNSHFNNPNQRKYDHFIKELLQDPNVRKKITNSFINKLTKETFNIDEYFAFSELRNIAQHNKFIEF